MNVTELARRIKVSPNEMRDLFPLLGYDIGRKAIKVDNAVAHRIIEMLDHDRSIIDTYRRNKLTDSVDVLEPTAPTKTEITVPPVITVRDFAALIEKPVAAVIQELMKNGILANLNEQIDFETASIIAQDFGVTTVAQTETAASEAADTERETILADSDHLLPRPPIVVVMGHVDHGKTKLLDAIRTTNVVASESGGITQHIGAYQVTKNNRLITFIDTPGHQAFTAMRSRGARVADIAILVIAADDGIKPQTEEAIQIIKSAKLPYLVAMNKVDKAEADVKRLQSQLAQKNILSEEWGGSVMTLPVSAKTGEGIDALLEHVILLADMEKEAIVANPDRSAAGTVIESHVHKGEGPVATVIVQTGTLHRGDHVQVGTVVGKIRAMKDHRGKDIDSAPPSTPVKLLGLKNAPEVGDVLQVTTEDVSLKKIEKQLHHKARSYRDTQTWKQTQKNNDETESPAKEVHIILRTDTLGSQEALLQSLETITAKDVSVTIVKKGLGNITDADVLEAESVGARIYGFNVKSNPQVENLAQEHGVPIRVDTIIYNLIDDVQERVNALVTYDKIKVEQGRAKVVAIFRTERKTMIVGAQITKGKAIVNALVTVMRDEKPIGRAQITGIRQGKESVTHMPAGTECGISLKGTADIREGDFLECYTEELSQ
ncbi:MAG: translation initiation factor IF-2 [Patescibacteria group bacterium]